MRLNLWSEKIVWSLIPGLAVLVMGLAAENLFAAVPNVSPYPVAPPSTLGKEVAPEPSGTTVYKKAVKSVVYIVCQANGREGYATGAGSILDAKGVILTNLHVISGADRCFAFLKPAGFGANIEKETPYNLTPFASDRTKDLALIAMTSPPAGLVPILLGEMQDIDVGQEVHAIGHPQGKLWTYTKGVVSQVRLQEKGIPPMVADVVQTQTPISPGNSGGPLLSSAGKLVAVNTWVRTDAQNLNFSVAVSEVWGFIDRVNKGEHRVARSEFPREQPAPEGKSGDCEPRELGKRRSAKRPGTIVSFDIGCRGRANAELLIPDDSAKERIFYVSTLAPEKDEKPVYDKRYYLDPKTNKILRSWHDVDHDGHPDYMGVHKNGEAEPSSFIPFNAQAE